VEGKAYRVTANCHAVLLRLREISQIYVWIDAICINQSDDAEKSIQVALMTKIYRFAEEVIVWLGPDGAVKRQRETEARENLVSRLLNELKFEQFENQTSFERFVQRTKMIESSSWQPLRALLGHPWFSRVWTFQEYIVARKATALLLYRAIPFKHISEIAIKVLLAMPEPVLYARPLCRALGGSSRCCGQRRGAVKV
jgi:hypothetical protein